MIDKESRAVVCDNDECKAPLEVDAFTVDDDGCYCLDCAVHLLRENLTNSNSYKSGTIDKVSIYHFINCIEDEFSKAGL